jgi:hypothetical protein
MKKNLKSNLVLPAITASMLLGISLVPVAVNAAPVATVTASPTITTSNTDTLSTIIAKGNAAIAERLVTLNNLIGVINSTTNKLTPSDRAYLLSEVNGEISGLTNLKTQLDAETTVSAARADYLDIFTQYRVYLLVNPKVRMVKAADDQQATESKLTTLAGKLQTRIDEASKDGKNVTQVQTWLNDMETNTSNAKGISSTIETIVLTITPAQYDADPTILKGDLAQLQQAHSDNKAAYNYAKEIVSVLKGM